MELRFENVNDALPAMARILSDRGVVSESRNGPVICMQEPVTIYTAFPDQRVLLCPVRRANPFLFLVDGLSILSSNDSVKPYLHFTPRMSQFSDDGLTLRGHYGKRIYDAKHSAVRMFKADSTTRRVYLPIFNDGDLEIPTADVPCNVGVLPRINEFSEVDMLVINRSNDLYWGMLGANIVQFSILQQWLAEQLDRPMGTLMQMSSNLHVYRNQGPGIKEFPPGVEYPNEEDLMFGPHIERDVHYAMRTLQFEGPGSFMNASCFDSPFMRDVFYPMMMSWCEKSARNLPKHTSAWFEAARMWFKEIEA